MAASFIFKTKRAMCLQNRALTISDAISTTIPHAKSPASAISTLVMNSRRSSGAITACAARSRPSNAGPSRRRRCACERRREGSRRPICRRRG